MDDQIDRYTILSQAIEEERKQEEQYYLELSSKKKIQERVLNGFVWYPVQIKKSHFTIGEQIEVVVERSKNLDQSHKFKVGIGCILNFLEADKIQYRGTISFVKKNTMGIIFGSNVFQMDQLDHSGKISVEIIYDERPYRVMQSTLRSVQTSKLPHIVELREGIRKLDVFNNYNQAEQKIEPDETKLNESQYKALKGALYSNRMAIIHGPPGTGKTTSLVEISNEILQTEKRILVAAPSNNAVDLLAIKLQEAGLSVLRLGNVTRVGDSLAHLTLHEKAREHPEWKHIKKIKIEAVEAKKQAQAFKRKFGHKERQNRRDLYKESKDLRDWAKSLEEKIIQTIISEAQVICCTLIGSAHKLLHDIHFETLIIDEASQALEPECWTAMLKANRVIFAGDHLQLPPTIKSAKAKELGLEETLLSRMTDIIEASFLLKQQYRMNDKILSFSNQKFYDNQLYSHPSVADQTIDSDPVVFIDTSGCGFEEKINPENQSKFNEGEYFILEEFFAANKEVLKDQSIGIISPYAQQVKYIKSKHETEEIYRDFDIWVNTIDGFQGQERDVIVISLVRSNEMGEIGFLNDARRLNVALTRAKKKLVIIGDISTLANSELFRELAEHIEKHCTYQSAWEYMQ